MAVEKKKEELLTAEMVEEFLQSLTERGRSPDSIIIYRQILKGLSACLPEGGKLGADTGIIWKRRLEEQGLSPRTINARLSVWNSLCQYLSRKEWMQNDFSYDFKQAQPELTRREYLRLLQAAKILEKERSYLLIKTLGGAGLRIQELPQLTVEAVRSGTVELESHNHMRKRVLHLPEVLREELLEYLRREGIRSGAVFTGGEGEPLGRSSIYYHVNCVSRPAQVAEEKATPRCLWKMYQNTCAGIRANVDFLVEQAYIRLLDEEQLTVGWDEKTTFGKLAEGNER